MKNYEKPVVMVNEGLAEGVYAASGCFHYYGAEALPLTDRPEGYLEGGKCFVLKFQHSEVTTHSSIAESFTLSVTFNAAIANVSICDNTGTSATANGEVVTITDSVSNANERCIEEVRICVVPSNPSDLESLYVVTSGTQL